MFGGFSVLCPKKGGIVFQAAHFRRGLSMLMGVKNDQTKAPLLGEFF